MDDVLLSVSSPSDLDLELFQNWVSGKSEQEACKLKLDYYRKKDVKFHLEFRVPREQHFNDQSDFVKLEVDDQYRAFELLEHSLAQPLLLKTQCLIALRPDYQPFLVDSYWSVDDSFVREILNKRFARSRKDLEEAAESNNLNLRSVTRQFDNIKRVFNAFEDPSNVEDDNLYTFLTKKYLLSPLLARKYACIVFLLISKFNLASKKRLLNVECEK
jgi:hypothetical protein